MSMGLDSLLKKIKGNSVTPVTPCNVRDVTLELAPILDVTPVTSVMPQITNDQHETIKSRPFKIGEPEEDHDLIIDKCRNNPQVSEYSDVIVSDDCSIKDHVWRLPIGEPREDDRRKCTDCLHLDSRGYCLKYAITNYGVRYRPVQDTLKRCSAFELDERKIIFF